MFRLFACLKAFEQKVHHGNLSQVLTESTFTVMRFLSAGRFPFPHHLSFSPVVGSAFELDGTVTEIDSIHEITRFSVNSRMKGIDDLSALSPIEDNARTLQDGQVMRNFWLVEI